MAYKRLSRRDGQYDKPKNDGNQAKPPRLPRGVRSVNRGGAATSHRRHWMAQLCQLEPTDPALRQRMKGVEQFLRAHATDLARHFGLGEASAGVCQLVASASLCAAARDLLLERGEYAIAARMMAEMRQSLVAAHATCAREAEARAANGQTGRKPWEPRARAALPVDTTAERVDDSDAWADRVVGEMEAADGPA